MVETSAQESERSVSAGRGVRYHCWRPAETAVEKDADPMPTHAYRGVSPRFGEGVFVAPSAVIVGDTTLGDDVSFWLHAVARGDVNWIRIGARVLDGAVVGREAQIAAGALVVPGQRIPGGHLAMGMPARIVRPLTSAQQQEILAISKRYLDLEDEYLEGLGRPT